jgi:hypothetical protein
VSPIGSTGSTGGLERPSDTGTPNYSADTSLQSNRSPEQRHVETKPVSYQPAQTEVNVTERRSAARPSKTVVIGSAVAAAVVGGAVPFMLAARKSRRSEEVSVQRAKQHDVNVETATAQDSSAPGRRR